MEVQLGQFRRYLENDPELVTFGQDAHAVYTLTQHLNFDDYQTVSDRFSTDGKNDKSCDFCVIDLSSRTAAIVQAYFDASWSKAAAKANKAATLNQAVAWLLAKPLAEVPDALRPHAEELRRCIEDEEIDNIEIIFVHNCPESDNVSSELDAVQKQLERTLGSHVRPPAVSAIELGLTASLEIYSSHVETLAIGGDVEILGEFGLVEGNDKWRSVQGKISGLALVQLYKQYQGKLFSANVREYLGSTKGARNINAKITQTATSEPENFYAYNNGVTFLTRGLIEIEGGIKCSGISVINGAQTTGSLAASDIGQASRVKVLCRIIECSDSAMVDKIVRYTNTQNAVKAADRKSNDAVQLRLTEEFNKLSFNYRRRRGVPTNDSKGSMPVISLEAVSQALASFHGELNLAIRNRQDIFESGSSHEKLFHQRTTARHLLLVEAFSRAITIQKKELQKAASVSQDGGDALVEFLDYAASKQFVLGVIGGLQNTLVGAELEDRFEVVLLQSYAQGAYEEFIEICRELVEMILPLILNEVDSDFYSTVRSKSRMDEVTRKVGNTLKAFNHFVGPALIKYRSAVNFPGKTTN